MEFELPQGEAIWAGPKAPSADEVERSANFVGRDRPQGFVAAAAPVPGPLSMWLADIFQTPVAPVPPGCALKGRAIRRQIADVMLTSEFSSVTGGIPAHLPGVCRKLFHTQSVRRPYLASSTAVRLRRD